LIVIALVAVIGATPAVDHDLEHIHRPQVGVAEDVEGLDDFFLTAPLGGRVRHDGEGARRSHPVERPSRGRQRAQRRSERHLAQVQTDGVVPKRGVEDEAHAGEPRERGEHVAAAGTAEQE
jgi:hypothetical protein